jgi:hypothetical protein
MSNDSEILFHPSIERHPFAYLGALSSSEMDALADEAANDIVRLSGHHNALVAISRARRESSHRDVHHLLREVKALRARLDHLDWMNATRGVRLKLWHDLHSAGPVSFLDNATQNRHAQIATTYGHATIPMDGIESRFYGTNLMTGAIVPAEDLSISVAGIFDKGGGDGLTDYEGGTERLLLDEGDPTLAFNGINIDTWVRRLEFPLDSDIDEIETQITVRVPSGTNAEANVAVIHPHPAGNVDITGLWVASDLGDTFAAVSGFAETANTWAKRWYFPGQVVQQIRVRLRQRDWVEENGRKVFYIGAQEIGVYLVDWDKTWDSAADPENNHTFLTRFDAPDGFAFNTLHAFRTDPMFTDETAGQRHLHFQVALDDALSSVVWNSDSDSAPQASATGIDLGGSATSIYVLSMLNWVASSGGAGSPYAVGTPPWMAGLGMEVTVSAV